MKLLIFVLVCCALPIFSQARRCLECSHSDYPPFNEMGAPNDNDCKKGDKKFANECTSETPFPWYGETKMQSGPQKKSSSSKNITATANGKQRQLTFSCFKMVSKHDSHTTIFRGCAFNEEDECSSEELEIGGVVYPGEFCGCNSDECNSATKIFSGSFVGIFTLINVIIRSYF